MAWAISTIVTLAQIGLTVASIIYTTQQVSKAKRQAEEEADKAKGFMVPQDGTTGTLPVVYGKAKLGGVRTFVKTKGDLSLPASVWSIYNNPAAYGYDKFFGTFPNNDESYFPINGEPQKNEYLVLEQALCPGPIESIEKFLVNDIEMGYPEIEIGVVEQTEIKKLDRSMLLGAHYSGNTSDVIVRQNFSERTTATYTNIAYLFGAFRLNRDDPQYQGIPEVTVLVKGRKVKTIINTNGVYTLSSTRSYTNNSAIVLLDYLLDFVKIPVENINLKSFYDASIICDRVVDNKIFGGEIESPTIFKRGTIAANSTTLKVNLEDGNTANLSVGMYVNGQTIIPSTTITAISGDTVTLSKACGNGFENKYLNFSGTVKPVKLYEFNGTLSTEDDFRSNISKILNTMSSAMLIWSSGQYKLMLNYYDNNSQLVNVPEITEEELVANSFDITWPDTDSKMNRAEVKFFNEALDFQEDIAYWPPKE